MSSLRLIRPAVAVCAILVSLNLPAQAPQGAARGPQPAGGPPDAWAGKRKLLVIADPVEWYGANNYHHQAASHAMAVVERMGRESGAYVSMIRTDMHLLTKGSAGEGANIRNLNYFDAIFYMGEGPWNITDQQKADLLSFVHEDGKGFFAAHAGNGGHLLLWPEYAEMVGGNLVSEFSSLDMPIVVEDRHFPGTESLPPTLTFRDQYTIVGPNYSREKNHVIMSLDGSKIDRSNPAVARVSAHFREDNDFPIVWAKPYGKGRVFYSSFGHEDATMDDPRIQKLYLGAIKWVLGDAAADITPRPMPKH
ncbi:MAG TPA: ThuA domain-containing protein [Bryobacteraceae bacterium]